MWLIHNEIKKFLKESTDNDIISKNLANNLLPEEPKAGALYLLSKVHKQNDKIETPSGNNIPKGRPIISGCGSNTERISWFVDQHTKDFVKKHESYIQDTPDLLRYLKKVEEEDNLPPEAFPASIDIKSTYTNIPIEEGLKPWKTIPTDLLLGQK